MTFTAKDIFHGNVNRKTYWFEINEIGWENDYNFRNWN